MVILQANTAGNSLHQQDSNDFNQLHDCTCLHAAAPQRDQMDPMDQCPRPVNSTCLMFTAVLFGKLKINMSSLLCVLFGRT